MRIARNTEACVGCRLCELACSFHHTRGFSPEASSIRVSMDNQNGEIRLSIDSTCDLCKGEDRPLCIEYCLYGALKESVKSEDR